MRWSYLGKLILLFTPWFILGLICQLLQLNGKFVQDLSIAIGVKWAVYLRWYVGDIVFYPAFVLFVSICLFLEEARQKHADLQLRQILNKSLWGGAFAGIMMTAIFVCYQLSDNSQDPDVFIFTIQIITGLCQLKLLQLRYPR